MLPHEDDLPQDQPNYIDPPPPDTDNVIAPDASDAGDVPARRSSRSRADDAGHVANWQDPTGKPPPALSAGPSIGSIVQGLKRRWWLALGIGVLVGAGAGVGAWYGLEPPYTAFANVHVATVPPWLVHARIDIPDSRNEFITYKGLQSHQLRSRRVLNAAMIRPEVKGLAILKEQPDPLLWLEDQIKVETQEASEIMNITMTGANSDAVKALVNGVREAYFDEVVTEERKHRKDRARLLDNIVTKTTTDLDNRRERYNRKAEELGTSDTGVISQKQLNLTTLLSVKRQHLAQRQYELKNAEARLEALQGQQPLPPPGPAEPGTRPRPTSPEPIKVTELQLNEAINNDGRVKLLEDNVERARNYVERCEKHLFGNDPVVIKARQRVAKEEGALQARKDEVRQAVVEAFKRQAEAQAQSQLPMPGPNIGPGQATTVEQGKIEVGALKKYLEELQTEVDNLTTESDKLNRRSTDLERLRDDVRGQESQLETYRKELDALRIELDEALEARVTKFQDAGLQRRDTKRQLLGAIVVPLVVLLAVCFGVGWWESRARRINTAEEVARGLGMRVVGAVPEFSRRGRKNEEAMEHLLMESIDSIRTQLLRAADTEPMQVVMVTSASSGEGKTTVASQLAGSLARAGRRTLLIDTDLRRPAAHQLFELPLQPGLSEVLMDEAHIAEATLSTEVDGLWMVPAGQWDREVIQALAKDQLRKIFEKLRQAYDFIVVDSHPVLPATDSLLIGQHADAVLLAVMRDVSEAPKVYAAMQRLASLQIHVLGAVVSGLPEQAVINGSYGGPVAALR